MYTINNFLFKAQIDNINLFKVFLFAYLKIMSPVSFFPKQKSSKYDVFPTLVTQIHWKEHDQQEGKYSYAL